MRNQIDFFISLLVFCAILLYAFIYPFSSLPAESQDLQGSSEALLLGLRPEGVPSVALEKQKLIELQEKPINQIKSDLELTGKDVFIGVDFPSLQFTRGSRGNMEMITRYAVLDGEIGTVSLGARK